MTRSNGAKAIKPEAPKQAQPGASPMSAAPASAAAPVAGDVTLLDLQRGAGNRTLSRWLQSGTPWIQTKSNNNSATDAAEQQADAAAEKVTEKQQSPAKSSPAQPVGQKSLAPGKKIATIILWRAA